MYIDFLILSIRYVLFNQSYQSQLSKNAGISIAVPIGSLVHIC